MKGVWTHTHTHIERKFPIYLLRFCLIWQWSKLASVLFNGHPCKHRSGSLLLNLSSRKRAIIASIFWPVGSKISIRGTAVNVHSLTKKLSSLHQILTFDYILGIELDRKLFSTRFVFVLKWRWLAIVFWMTLQLMEMAERRVWWTVG